MSYVYNPLLGAGLDQTGAGGGGGTPGGSTTQVQFNDAGSFGGDADLTWNKTTNVLGVTGDINLSDGGTYTTTIQTVTATANRTISFPDATGTVALVAGSSGQLTYNNAGSNAGATGSVVDSSGNVTIGGLTTLAGSPSANNTSGVLINGTWRTGASSNNPQLLLNPTGTTLSTTWSPSGTGIGVNAPASFGGNLLDLQVNGTRQANVASNGDPRFGAFGTQAYAGGFIVTTNTAGNAYSGYWGNDKLQVAPTMGIGWGSSNGYDSASLSLFRDAANTLAQRNGTSAQTTRVYDTYTSDTDYHRIAIATARATLSNVSGASVTATGLIPAGAVVMGVTSKVTTALGTANGTTGYKIGTGADDDRWGAITGTAAGTTSDNRNWTAGTIECFPSATDVIVTATGGNFNGTGVIYLSVQYMTGQAD